MTLSINTKQLTQNYVDAGFTVAGIAKVFNISPTAVVARLRKWNLKAKRQKKQVDDQIVKRNAAICELYLKGQTLEEVGQQFNITRERVRQILVINNVTERNTKSTLLRKNKQPLVAQVMTFYLQGHRMQQAAKLAGTTLKEIQSYLPDIKTIQVRQHRSSWFWLQADKQTEPHPVLKTPCWLWSGLIHSVSGYGACKIKSISTSSTAHVIAYTLAKGKPKKWVLHKCDTKICVNPGHLYDGSPADNARDRELARAYGRIRKKCRILISDEVVQIKQYIAEGKTNRQISSAFNVAYPVVCLIRTGKRHTGKSNAKIPDEKVLHVARLGRTVTGEENSRITGVALGSIWSILNGYIKSEITGIPKKERKNAKVKI